MPSTINLLDSANALERESISQVSAAAVDWVLSGGTLLTISTEFVNQNRFVLRLAPDTSSDLVLTVTGIDLPLDINGKTLSFNAQVKSGNGIIVTAVLSVVGQAAQSGNQKFIPGEIYGAVQSNTVLIPSGEQAKQVSISVTISGHNSTNSYLTMPNLIDDRGFYLNEFVSKSRNIMPDFLWDIDSTQTFPTAPFHRLIDILTTTANDVKKEYDAMFPFDALELSEAEYLATEFSNSALVDPSFVRDRYMSWLSQFNGAPLRRNIVDANNSNYLTNASLQRLFAEWQLANGFYGQASGTRQAMISAAKHVLVKTKNNQDSTHSVVLTPFFSGNQFFIRIQTLLNETDDVQAVGESSTLVLNAVEPARPMGYQVFHTTVASFAFTLDDITLGILGEVALG